MPHKHQVKEKHDPKAEKWQVVFFFFGLYNVQEQEKEHRNETKQCECEKYVFAS
jgi:hypothetical protein